ncbi:MAG: YicC family protein [Desulfobacterales bacterium C00003060]|nr:MAG: YicC family protein [Desulfobacterales bacterium C00003060]OEU83589.1 MAG: YicC family protein [Desulfobacterales bacterium S5133MH4]
MIKSMTAFGRAGKTVEGRMYAVEIRSLNGRYRDVTVHMPPQFVPVEDQIKKLVSTRISRGRVTVMIKVKNDSQAVSDIHVNLPLCKAYYGALCKLNETLQIEEKVGIQTLLGMQGIITATAPEEDLEKTWLPLSSCISEALEGLDAMRISEGTAIYQDFQKRLQSIEDSLSRIRVSAPSVLSQYHDRLKERIATLTQGAVDIEPNRLVQEAAFLAEKSDITEEVVRAESHLKQFRTMIETDNPAGRALDFLLQELNREVNTIGSKAGDAQLSHVVVEVKSELEKLREQVQNIE